MLDIVANNNGKDQFILVVVHLILKTTYGWKTTYSLMD
jgi:hypothetical protein